jgi:hypothetical protein
MKQIIIPIFVAIMLTAPVAAHATDGVIEINQAKIMANGGYPYVISQSGSYRLTSDLTVPNANTDGIDITAGDVTIDLNGFTIAGPTVCTGTPVTSCAPVGTGNGIKIAKPLLATVRNGTISGMGMSGIEGSVRAENITARANGLMGFRNAWGNSAPESMMTNCSSIGNGSTGYYLGGTLHHCSAFGNGGSGAATATTTSFLTVTNSSFANNGQSGVSGEGSILNSTVSYNKVGGMFFSGSIVGNYVTENGGYGIATVDGAVENNIVGGSTSYGLYCERITTMRGNVFNLNNSSGQQTGTAGGAVLLNAGGNMCGGSLCP